jgi:FdrA protein
MRTVELRRGTYVDSVTLMQVSRRVAALDGVTAAIVAMATDLNLELAAGMGFDVPASSPNELLVAVEGTAVDEALAEVDLALAEASRPAPSGFGSAPPAATVRSAAARSDATVALISTPGDHAFADAVDAVDAGLLTMVFSDNVPLEQEVALKEYAGRAGVLVMGPDCGTAVVGGVGLGFANVVRPGPVGVVAAAGTGAQEVACLIDAAGSGVSHIIGVGGRDLSTAVGGTMVRQGLAMLGHDEQTETLLLVAKEPQALEALANAVPGGKRAVAALVGWEGDLDGWEVHPTLEAAALAAARGAGASRDEGAVQARPGRVLGLFSGGSLAHEACVVLDPLLGSVATEPEAIEGDGHVVVDLGTERYTQGRPHPMVDFGIRLELLEAAADDGRTACVLLDVVCGHGAHADPASELAGAVARAARHAAVVVRVCGTDADPQDASRQAAALADAGAIVAPSNAAAARLAARAVA